MFPSLPRSTIAILCLALAALAVAVQPSSAAKELTFVKGFPLVGGQPETGKCCVDCNASAGLEKYFSVVKFPQRACGECCMKPSDYWKFKIFEPGLTKANVSDPCAQRGYEDYVKTVTHGFGPVKMTLDLYHLNSTGSAALRMQEKTEIISFDSQSAAYHEWEVVNDPVMGGVSDSTFHVSNDTGHFSGTVKVVPFLGKPGFAIARTKGSKPIPDISFAKGMLIVCKSHGTDGWSDNRGFQLQIRTRGGRSGAEQGTYTADFNAPASALAATDVIEWSAFNLTWRGRPIQGPKLVDQLDQITNIGIGVAGKAGEFDFDIHSIQVV